MPKKQQDIFLIVRQIPMIEFLRNPDSIRLACQSVLDLAEKNALQYFTYHHNRLEQVADYVIDVMQINYPTLDIPYHSRWRHFSVGNCDRYAKLQQKFGAKNAIELAKSSIDLVIVSVLLDAGAGMQWQYHDSISGQSYTRSEGLAVASFNLFMQGTFSADKQNPYRVDAQALQQLTEVDLIEGFQVADNNPLLGISGRLDLLRRLGKNISNSRLSDILDYWLESAQGPNLSMRTIFTNILVELSEIWPNGLKVSGQNVGDVWHYAPIVSAENPQGLIPFHKLSQWLCYSLLEPLEILNINVTEVEILTGLPEYRNGGLFVDLGVLELTDVSQVKKIHTHKSELVVEWRALTVIMLDKLSAIIRKKLSKTNEALPLAKILEGGTWAAGRKIAAKLRVDGGPPFLIESDGTIF